MGKIYTNPYNVYGKKLAPETLRELIIEKQRRINELTTAIQLAESYLMENLDSKPVTYRLGNMKKDLSRAYIERDRAECRLVVLRERIRERDKS
jgi:hypothetical protein